MELIANICLATGALGAAFYCYLLSQRLKRFTDLDDGIGVAISRLSRQVDQLNATLRSAQATASNTNRSVADQTERAEDVAQRLELLLASMHDIDLDKGASL